MIGGKGVWEKLTNSSRKSEFGADGAHGFPETESAILRDAAAGQWEGFLHRYLQPCVEEIARVCRQRRLPIADAPELLQELMVRLMSAGTFKRDLYEEEPTAPGNLPDRYLRFRESAERFARFRNYLKKVILHLVLENLRDRARQPRLGVPGEDGQLEPWIEQSISDSVERRWIAECLHRACAQLRAESLQARTRGERRLFEIFYLATVEGQTAQQIAQTFAVHRSTVAELLGRARERFVRLLRDATGIADPGELKNILAQTPEALLEALTTVKKSPGTEVPDHE